jgi:hypothetical protein
LQLEHYHKNMENNISIMIVIFDSLLEEVYNIVYIDGLTI